ncbi:Non-specific serine/threonine protein kinase [Bertholletia excelsa]
MKHSHLPRLLLVLVFVAAVSGDEADEANSLLKFRKSLSTASALSSWNNSMKMCSGNDTKWRGLLCRDNVVFGLRLEGMGLSGVIDVEALSHLPNLRTVSFMYNAFQGPLPEFKQMGSGALRALFLSNNQFSGEIPDDAFTGLASLRKVYLANNSFVGKIPASLAELPKLVELQLNDNQLDGEIPDFSSKKLATVNLANNSLAGPIPASLGNFNASSFSGNQGLCGKPLEPCKSRKKSITKVSIIVAGAGLGALIAISIASFLFHRHRQAREALLQISPPETPPTKLGKTNEFEIPVVKKRQNNYIKEEGSPENSPDQFYYGNFKKRDIGKLCFVREMKEFDLHDLLRASAQVLGSGSFGSSYKACITSGPIVAVKRFKHMGSSGREDFHRNLARLGSLSHPNLLPFIAYYYRKEEKLLVTDFVPNGAWPATFMPALDWPSRLKIIKGVARGLAYLYKELHDLTLPHGHLKSSNVLLDHTFEPILGDYALLPVVDKDHAQQFMVAYKSPEFIQHDRITNKTDVWSLGILILEILTGKFPTNYLKQGKGADKDLAAWVNFIVREEWTGEVFDKEMKKTKKGEGEMLELLRIGMCCCEWDPERRWDLTMAVEKIEQLKERDSDEDCSSCGSEEEMYSSRALTDDDFSFSVN